MFNLICSRVEMEIHKYLLKAKKNQLRLKKCIRSVFFLLDWHIWPLLTNDTTLEVFPMLVSLPPPCFSGPKCCSDSGDAIQSTSGNCRPISIPSNDPFYSQFNRKCMEYKHSEAINCSVEPFQPVILTVFFPLSWIFQHTSPGEIRWLDYSRISAFPNLKTSSESNVRERNPNWNFIVKEREKKSDYLIYFFIIVRVHSK